MREKIRKEAKLEQARKEKEDAGQEGHQACQGDVMGAGDRSQSGKATRKYGGRGGIRSHHEKPRRTK